MHRRIRKRLCKGKIFKFFPEGGNSNEKIYLSYEEFLILKLIDYENYSQEEVSKLLNISRVTISKILRNARKKLIYALINKVPIEIEEWN